jgi:DNA repair protein RadD
MIILRPYQIGLIEQIIKAINSGYRKLLIVAPTGSGKTLIMGGLVAQLALTYEISQIIVSVPHLALISQIQKVFNSQNLSALVETYQTSAGRLKDTTNIHIIDEAHHAGCPTGQQMLRMIQSDFLFGFTATPFRLDRNPLLVENGGPFEKIIEGPSIDELTKQDYLANINYYSYPLIKEVHKEYRYMRYGTRYEHQTVTYVIDNHEDDIVNEYNSQFAEMPTFVFCKTIVHAANIAAKFNAAGISAGHLSCYNPKSITAQTIENFKIGKIQVLAACNMASEGMDVSRAKLAIMARKINQSVTLYIQQLGRTMRPYNNQEANVLDLVGNVYRFGSIQQAYHMEVI